LSTVFNIVIACAAVSLIVLGWTTGLKDQTATTGAVLGFAVVLFLILVGTRFKIVRGFGFHAESWDQKQIEAATLIERLSAMTETVSRNVALIASKLGLWDSGFSNPQLADLLATNNAILGASEVPKATRDELLGPVINRIKINYYNAGQQVVTKALDNAMRNVDGELRVAPEPERAALQAKHAALSDARQKLRDAALFQRLTQAQNLEPLIAIIRLTDFSDKQSALDTLRELDEDVRYFAVNTKLRRSIDLTYLYR
jgi:hypothetical protein